MIVNVHIYAVENRADRRHRAFRWWRRVVLTIGDIRDDGWPHSMLDLWGEHE